MTKVIIEKMFRVLAETEAAKGLNRGDIFLPNGTGLEFMVTKNVCRMIKDEYMTSVMVKPLSRDAKRYALTRPHWYD